MGSVHITKAAMCIPEKVKLAIHGSFFFIRPGGPQQLIKRSRFPHPHIWVGWDSPPRCVIVFWPRDSFAIRLLWSTLKPINCKHWSTQNYPIRPFLKSQLTSHEQVHTWIEIQPFLLNLINLIHVWPALVRRLAWQQSKWYIVRSKRSIAVIYAFLSKCFQWLQWSSIEWAGISDSGSLDWK